MTTLTVGSGQEYSTIAAAVAASSSGDTIDVQAGTYTNDFVTITHDLTLQAVGGTVTMVATEQPPDGKAMIDEGGSGVTVTISGFDISGVTVADGNGAAVRYEGGTLTLDNVNVHDNQDGLLGAADPAGSITIENSTFTDNGTGTGSTHDIYVGDIASLTVTGSTITSAVVGHEIKSRAESNTITNNVIGDGSSGDSSYEIDLPNGGTAVISGNVIQKGVNADNKIAIAFGEEGSVYANSSLTVANNTILDDAGTGTTVWNDTSTTASITGNTLYGWSTLVTGAAITSDNTTLATEPTVASAAAALGAGASSSTTTSGSSTTTGTSTTSTTSTGTTTTGTTSTSTDSTGMAGTDPTGTSAVGSSTPPTSTTDPTTTGTTSTSTTNSGMTSTGMTSTGTTSTGTTNSGTSTTGTNPVTAAADSHDRASATAAVADWGWQGTSPAGGMAPDSVTGTTTTTLSSVLIHELSHSAAWVLPWR